MRNKQGLSRSSEFLKGHPEQAPKAPELHHMRITPTEKGVTVSHHALGHEKPFHQTNFTKSQGEELTNHVMEHTGMAYDSEGGGEHYADAGQETEK